MMIHSYMITILKGPLHERIILRRHYVFSLSWPNAVDRFMGL